jgi:taurine dioxygenase
MRIEPFAGALGAEIQGADLRNLPDTGWREVHEAFLRYSVLVFREQDLEPADIMRVGGRFGEPCFYPFVTGIEGFPYLFEVVKEESETTNFGGNWHSDTTYLERPPLGTLLYAVETPSHGGDTLFASTCAAYAALSDAMKSLLDGLVGVNSAALKHGGGRHQMHKTINSMKLHDIEGAERYEAEHPVVRTHPDTGRKALYVSRSHTVRFRGMTDEESRPLIDFLQAHQTRPEFTCRVRWAPGTLTVWDNRCTQHNAVNDYHGQRRRMRRLTVGPQAPE